MSTQLLTEMMEKVVLLSDEEKQSLLSFLNGQNQTNSKNGETQSNKPDTHRVREREWLRQHRSEYAGQYVALDGNRLVSHGTDGRQVYKDAEQAGVMTPYIVRIEAEDEPPFGGW